MSQIDILTRQDVEQLLRPMFDDLKHSLLKSITSVDPDAMELLTVEEACRFLRIRSKSTIYTWIKNRRLPYSKIGNKTLFLKQDLINHIKQKSKAI